MSELYLDEVAVGGLEVAMEPCLGFHSMFTE